MFGMLCGSAIGNSNTKNFLEYNEISILADV